MKISKIVFLFGLLLFVTYNLNSNSKTATIIVNIEKFPNLDGSVRCQLWKGDKGFPTKTDYCFMKITDGKIKPDSTARLIFNDVPYGNYAVTVHHDENNSIWMDKNFLGYPTEAFGLSKNPKIYLSIPDYEDCSFDLDKDTIVIDIKLKFT